jgi:PAS domain S-box-containing protein
MSLDQFRLLAENVPVMCWLADVTGHIFWYNRRWYDYTGATPEEMEGWGWQSVHDPLTLPEVLDRWKASLATGEPFEMVFPLRSAAGEFRPFLTRIEPVRDGEGRITHWCGANIDISAQRVAEEALGGANARLRAMLDALPIMASLQRVDGEAEFLNRRYLDYLGDPPRGIFAGRRDVVHPDDHSALLAARKHALGEGVGAAEVRLRRRDGAWRWHLVRWTAFDAEPSPRFLVTSVDIHDRHEAAEQIAKSEEQLRLAVEAAEVGLWDVDPVNDTLYWPPRVKAMFGFSPDAPVSMADFYAGLHPEDAERVGAAYAAAADPAVRSLYDVEYRTVGKEDGIIRWVAAKGRGIFDDSGACIRVIGTAIDITARRALEAQLRRLNERLEARVQEEVVAREAAQTQLAHAQRMDALGQLAGGIAHDFNNIMQAVASAAALIERGSRDPERVRNLARSIRETVARGAAITRRLLTFSRRADLETEPIKAAGLLNELKDILTHTLGGGVSVRVEVEPDLPLLVADKGQLETTLVNLATNARDAMAGAGELTIAAGFDVIRGADGAGNPADLRAGSYIRFAVSDTGAGMAPEILAKASEPFFTTKAVGKGTGLGLAMARGFVEQSGGGLSIESEVGCGTVVNLWLPVSGDKAPPSSQQADEDLTPRWRTARDRLLLVDDDEAVLSSLAQQMEALGYPTLTAGSGAEAIARLDKGADVDLVVTDLSMPGMDGLRLIQEVQRRRPALPTILLTGFTTTAAEVALRDATSGLFSVLHKPIDGRLLAERVEVLLEAARRVAAY